MAGVVLNGCWRLKIEFNNTFYRYTGNELYNHVNGGTLERKKIQRPQAAIQAEKDSMDFIVVPGRSTEERAQKSFDLLANVPSPPEVLFSTL